MGIGIVSILHGFNGAVRTSIYGGGAILMLIFDVIYNIYVLRSLPHNSKLLLMMLCVSRSRRSLRITKICNRWDTPNRYRCDSREAAMSSKKFTL